MYKNYSPLKFYFWYISNSTDKNFITLINMKYLNASRTLAKVALPSRMTARTQPMLLFSEEKEAVLEASVLEKDIPMSACFMAA